MGQVEITRASTVDGAILAYGVYIDDVRVGQVRGGETKLFDVPDGEHTVECMTSSPYGSRRLQIDVGDTITRLYCKPGNNKGRLYADDRILLWVGDANQVTEDAELPVRRYQPGFWIPAVTLLLALGVMVAKAVVAIQFDASMWLAITIAVLFICVGVYLDWNQKRREHRAAAAAHSVTAVATAPNQGSPLRGRRSSGGLQEYSPLMRVVIYSAAMLPVFLFGLFVLLAENAFNRIPLPNSIEAESFTWPSGCQQRDFSYGYAVDDACLTWSNRFNVDFKYDLGSRSCHDFYRLGNKLVGVRSSIVSSTRTACYVKEDQFYQAGQADR